VHRRRRAGVLGPPVDVGGGLPGGHELDRPRVGVGDPERPFALLDGDAALPENAARVLERRLGVQLVRDVVEPGLAALDELEAVGLVVAGEERASCVAAALDEPELDAPPRCGLVQVGDAQTDVVDAAEADQGVWPSFARGAGMRRSASRVAGIPEAAAFRRPRSAVTRHAPR
jgi:hypothetical protein